MKLLQKPHPKDGVYEIPPSEAQKILETQGHNRPLSEWWAQTLADDIAVGQYDLNGEPIIFDDHEKLLDGQHRLRACVIANKPLRTYVIWGVPRKVFETLDQGRKRTAGDIESMAGTHNARNVAAVAGLVAKHDIQGEQFGNVPLPRAVPPWQIRKLVRKDKTRLEDAVSTVMSYSKKLGKSLPASAVGFVYYRAVETSPVKAKAWLHALATMEGLNGKSAVLLLRRRLTKSLETGDRIDGAERLALLAKTWLAFQQDQPMELLRWSRGEKFPAI